MFSSKHRKYKLFPLVNRRVVPGLSRLSKSLCVQSLCAFFLPYKCRFCAELEKSEKYSRWGQRQKAKSTWPWASIFTLLRWGNRCRFSESAIIISEVHPLSKIKLNQTIQTLRWRLAKVAFDIVRLLFCFSPPFNLSSFCICFRSLLFFFWPIHVQKRISGSKREYGWRFPGAKNCPFLQKLAIFVIHWL